MWREWTNERYLPYVRSPMPKEETTFVGTILTVSHWNAGCGKLGTSTSVTIKTLTKYSEENSWNGAEITLEERHWPNTGTNTKDMAPNWHHTKGTNLIPGLTLRKWCQTNMGPKAPTLYWKEHYGNGTELTSEERHRPNNGTNPMNWRLTNAGGKAPTSYRDEHQEISTHFILERKAPTLRTGRQAPFSYQDDRHWPRRGNERCRPHTGTTGTSLADGTKCANVTPGRQALT